jgi:hypothetical protein
LLVVAATDKAEQSWRKSDTERKGVVSMAGLLGMSKVDAKLNSKVDKIRSMKQGAQVRNPSAAGQAVVAPKLEEQATREQLPTLWRLLLLLAVRNTAGAAAHSFGTLVPGPAAPSAVAVAAHNVVLSARAPSHDITSAALTVLGAELATTVCAVPWGKVATAAAALLKATDARVAVTAARLLAAMGVAASAYHAARGGGRNTAEVDESEEAPSTDPREELALAATDPMVVTAVLLRLKKAAAAVPGGAFPDIEPLVGVLAFISSTLSGAELLRTRGAVDILFGVLDRARAATEPVLQRLCDDNDAARLLQAAKAGAAEKGVRDSDHVQRLGMLMELIARRAFASSKDAVQGDDKKVFFFHRNRSTRCSDRVTR